jgi:hypothetical protein
VSARSEAASVSRRPARFTEADVRRVLKAADWVTHHCDVIETGNESWRFKHRA